jgi:hypothetical protein
VRFFAGGGHYVSRLPEENRDGGARRGSGALSRGCEAQLNGVMNQAILLSAERDVPDLEALLERIREGDAKAESELLEACGEGIRFFLRRSYGPEDLEAAFQRVWEALLARLRRDAGSGGLAELVRRAAQECGLKAPARPPAAAPNALRAILRNCSARERAFLERCYLRNEDPAEVARQLNMAREEVTALYRKVGRPGSAARSRRAAAG